MKDLLCVILILCFTILTHISFIFIELYVRRLNNKEINLEEHAIANNNLRLRSFGLIGTSTQVDTAMVLFITLLTFTIGIPIEPLRLLGIGLRTKIICRIIVTIFLIFNCYSLFNYIIKVSKMKRNSK